MRAISLFSGAMGLDQGMEEAGIEIRLAVERDKYACQTIRANRPNLTLIESDIRTVTSEEIYQLSGINPDEGIDLLFGGPPCQSFSTAGKRRAFNDDKGVCIIQFIRILRELNPKYFLMENVKGLISASLSHRPINERRDQFPPLSADEQPGSVLRYILDEFNALGYAVDYRILNAADYGVPQARHRIVFLGSRVGGAIEFPETTHSKDPTAKSNQKPWVQLGAVLENLKNVQEHHFPSYSNDRLKFMQMIPKGGGNWRDLPKDLIKEAMGGAYESTGGRVGFYKRLNVDMPSPTLLTSPHQKATNLGHPYEDRPLSIEEYRAIQQFPDNWILTGNLSEQYRQVGNAVPLGLSKVLGEAIILHDKENMQ